MTVRMHRQKKYIVKFFDKMSMEKIRVVCGGRLFQGRGAAMENEGMLSVKWVRGTAMDGDSAEIRPGSPEG